MSVNGGDNRSRAVTLALLAVPVAMIAAGLAMVLPAIWRGAQTVAVNSAPGAGTGERKPAPGTATKGPSAKGPTTTGPTTTGPSTTAPAAPGTAAPGPAAPGPAGTGANRMLTLAEAVKLATPDTPWRSVAPDTVMTRIGFGSCLDQRYPQPIWSAVAAARPQLFLMMGDNVYGDIKSPDARELAEAYRRQLQHPEFAAARAALPMLGTWDDHDFGQNDAAAGFAHQATAAALFGAYWQRPAAGGARPGVYHAHVLGPPGRRVQIILLDTRSFRSPLAAKPQGAPLAGKYGADADPAKTMLGAAQWAWLEAELRKPAELRLVVSSIQVLSDGHAFERWGALPRERDRLTRLIVDTGAKGVLLLSGDRHMGAIYNRPIAAGQLLIEITSSSLNRSYGPAKDVRTTDLVSDLNHVENFGVIDIDWAARRLKLSLRGMGGEELDGLAVSLADLGVADKAP